LSNLLTYWLTAAIGLRITGIPPEFLTQYRQGVLEIVLFLLPLISFLSVVVLIIGTGVAHVLARLWGGLAAYSQLIYALAAFVAPLTILRIVLNGLLHVQGASSVLWIYGCLLTILTLKSLHRLNWKPALLLGVSLGSLLAVPVSDLVVTLALFGPTVSRMLNLSK